MLKSLKRAAVRRADRRALAELRPDVEATLASRRELADVEDAGITERTVSMRLRRRRGKTSPDTPPFHEACALACEASRRAIGLDPRPEQILAAAALVRGGAVELPTGEGKTLAAALAAYVEVLGGKRVHIIPPNDYLAARDAAWMKPLFGLGRIGVGCARPGLPIKAKRRVHGAAVVYGAGPELGFDFLRDQLRMRAIDKALRGLDVAILDEIDSLLLDEALTPLVIGGGAERDDGAFARVTMAVEQLKPDIDFDVDERWSLRTLTDEGLTRLEGLLEEAGLLDGGSIYDPENADVGAMVTQCLRALGMRRDRDYLVSEDGRVLPLDVHTGRALDGRRWADGLHQAVEAKERVEVRPEHRIRAMCSYERFLRSYEKVSGMTGTASGIEEELGTAHGLRLYRIPPHVPCVREDEPDRVFLTEREKIAALVEEIARCHDRGQPVLVGVPTEEKAVLLARALRSREITHQLLTAKHHAKEAEIVARAGQKGAVTVATQVAGRGTDIQLDDDARRLGGLRILGLERHRSRRLDDQLRGRAGRGGDPGSSCFFVSCEDDLLTKLADPAVRGAVASIMTISDAVARKIERWADEAQERVETMDADRRAAGRRLDSVFDEQRRTIATIRARVLSGRFGDDESDTHASEETKPSGQGLRDAVRRPVERLVAAHVEASKEGGARTIRPRALESEVYRLFGSEVDLTGRARSVETATEHLVSEVARSMTDQWRYLVRIADRVVVSLIREGEVDDFVERAEAVLGVRLPPLELDLPIEAQMKGPAGALRRMLRARRERPRLVLRYFRLVYLRELDRAFGEHLVELTRMRDELALKAYTPGDPVTRYKREAYEAFRAMMGEVDRATLAAVLNAPALGFKVLNDLEQEIMGGGRRSDVSDGAPPIKA